MIALVTASSHETLAIGIAFLVQSLSENLFRSETWGGFIFHHWRFAKATWKVLM
jgi:hypothetical protein